jgi:hypothetical protein
MKTAMEHALMSSGELRCGHRRVGCLASLEAAT